MPMTEKGLRSQVEGWDRNRLQREDQRVSGEEGVQPECGELFQDWSLKRRVEKRKVSGVECGMEGRVSLIKTGRSKLVQKLTSEGLWTGRGEAVGRVHEPRRGLRGLVTDRC